MQLQNCQAASVRGHEDFEGTNNNKVANATGRAMALLVSSVKSRYSEVRLNQKEQCGLFSIHWEMVAQCRT